MQESKDIRVFKPTDSGLPALAVPSIIDRAGAAARFAWEEHYLANYSNVHTRKAYLRAVWRFLSWVDRQNRELTQITPGMIGHYMSELPLSAPSKKLHLAAIRALLDGMVLRHVIVLNPALSVRTERFSQVEGVTPAITVEQARQLLASIELSSPIDFRDKAILGVLVYTAARAGAVAKLRIKDLVQDPGAAILKLREKNGKFRMLPVRHDLQGWLSDYLMMIPSPRMEPESPLFRTIGKDGLPTLRAVTGVDIWRMMKRRLGDAGLPNSLSPHSLRACTATDLLNSGVPLEAVQSLLGHADTRTTKLYDRRERAITRNIVERITV